LHHPYDAFGATVTQFVRHASTDPMVRAIKLTIYRTSGDSPIIQSLIHAAELGKQVAVLVEVKARFDEQANIEWARRLEEAGVHVAYGLVGLKIHCKTTLVVREEGSQLRRYCHIGTGNYNPKTAAIYEDLGLLTADHEIGDDLTQLFNFLTGYGNEVRFRNLMVAPYSLRSGVAALIANEKEMPEGTGRIVLKLNSLVDAELIEALYSASNAGVQIDLIIRGICCLRPGVPGMSDNIRVRSLVGRYLEHSRIFYFANGGGPGIPHYSIGSADLMPRNLDRRVEALVRIDDPDNQKRLAEVIEVDLADDELAWELRNDNVYVRHEERTVQAHDQFELLARRRSGLDRPTIADTRHRPIVRQRPAVPSESAQKGSSVEPAVPESDVPTIVRAAGCVVWRGVGDELRVVIVHRPRYDDWSFPKGKVDPGESELECALREVAEETNIAGIVGPELDTISYLDHKERRKTVRYWLLRYASGEFVANDEVDVLVWARPDEVREMLSYEHDRHLLDAAIARLTES
jgi:8-oxo-dGTP pyrophosphatase MutT (NUDIX family)